MTAAATIRERHLDRLVAARDVDGVVRQLEGLARKVVADFYAPGLEDDDLLQEARLGIAESCRDFDGGAGFLGFAHLCASRKVMTAVSGARRDKHQILNEAACLHTPPPFHDLGPEATLADVVPAAGGDAHHRVEIGAELAAIVARLDVLSPLERQVLGMWLSGVSYAEMAVTTGRDAKAIDNALQRTSKKLRAPAIDDDPPARLRRGVLLVDREIHRDARAAVREARRVIEGCVVIEISKKKVRGGRVVSPQGRASSDGSLGRPVWAIDVLAA